MKETAELINMTQVGRRIQERRVLLHLTQEKLAEEISCTSHYISEIERGAKQPSTDTFLLLSDYLNLSLDYMIRGITSQDAASESLLQLLRLCDAQQLGRIEAIVRSLLEFDGTNRTSES